MPLLENSSGHIFFKTLVIVSDKVYCSATEAYDLEISLQINNNLF